jgi:phage terminase small subunit
MMKRLSVKHRRFIDELFLCNLNATEAYMNVYAPKSRDTARVNASRLLTNANISAEIERRLAELKMSADEIILRYSQIARADIGDFMDITTVAAQVDLHKAKEARKTGLIKKVKQRTTITTHKDGSESEDHWIELELHDPLRALEQLGRHLKLFTDRVEMVDWRSEIIELIATEKVTYTQVVKELGEDLTQNLFQKAGKEIVLMDDD